MSAGKGKAAAGKGKAKAASGSSTMNVILFISGIYVCCLHNVSNFLGRLSFLVMSYGQPWLQRQPSAHCLSCHSCSVRLHVVRWISTSAARHVIKHRARHESSAIKLADTTMPNSQPIQLAAGPLHLMSTAPDRVHKHSK